MGMELGAAAGAYQGAQGTPDQHTSGTSQTTFAPASQTEAQLQEQSLQNYLQQVAMAGQYEQGIGSAQGLQDQSQQNIMALLNGSALQATPQEQANIQALRQGMIDQGSADVNRMLDERMKGLNASAADRGVRGQAQSQLQTGALRAGAEQMGNFTRQANNTAAQEMINAPYRRTQAQSPFMAQGMNFADQMRLQAQQNRMNAQNPYLLQLLNRERMMGGTTTNTGTNYGQQGNWADAVMGGMGGAAAGQSFQQNMGKQYGGAASGSPGMQSQNEVV